MGTTAPAARFDDLRPGRPRAWSFDAPAGVVRADTLAEVGAALDAVERATAEGLWATGWVAYEAGAAFDPALPVRSADVPLVWFSLWRHRRRVPTMLEGLGPVAGGDDPAPAPASAALHLDTDAGHHEAGVATIRAHIAAGDVYQVNLTARFEGDLAMDGWELARRLGGAQRGAHHAVVQGDGHLVISASPELFLQRRGSRVLTRPMKGTAARGRWPDDDAAAGAHLLASAKDRAELVMIVDLMRNDLGRLAAPGTVRADVAPRLEGYPTVWQLTARVAATVPAALSLRELLAATFPPGSVTGAPKVAACRIIDELERSPRGVYCGIVGWVGPGHQARFGVAIRTAVVHGATGVRYGAGGGITYDSRPAAEWAELAQKAVVLDAGPPRGVFETLRFTPRRGLVRVERHLARLAGAARRWCLPFDPAQVRACLAAAVEGHCSPARVRVDVHADGAVTARAEPLVRASGPVRLAVDDEPFDAADPRWSWKLAERERLDRRQARHPGADDVVLVESRGQVVETTTANLLLRLDGRWCTPPLDSGCLPGVGRAVLVEAGRVIERVCTVEDLRAAEALAVVSSLRGVRPAVLHAPTGDAVLSASVRPDPGGSPRSSRPR